MTPRYQYRDPLVGVLDYIAEVSLSSIFIILVHTVRQKCTDSVIAIAHDDDLQLVEEVVRANWFFRVPYANQ